MSSNWSVQRPCPHVRQDLACSCSAGDEQPNVEHHAQCLRQGWPCSVGRCSPDQETPCTASGQA